MDQLVAESVGALDVVGPLDEPVPLVLGHAAELHGPGPAVARVNVVLAALNAAILNETTGLMLKVHRSMCNW